VAVADTQVVAQAQVVLAVAVAVVLMALPVAQVAVLRLITAQTAHLLAVNLVALAGKIQVAVAVHLHGQQTRLARAQVARVSSLFATQFKENLNGTFCKSC
jgi:hypothetical protein